jgi:hypothetical protein
MQTITITIICFKFRYSYSKWKEKIFWNDWQKASPKFHLVLICPKLKRIKPRNETFHSTKLKSPLLIQHHKITTLTNGSGNIFISALYTGDVKPLDPSYTKPEVLLLFRKGVIEHATSWGFLIGCAWITESYWSPWSRTHPHHTLLAYKTFRKSDLISRGVATPNPLKQPAFPNITFSSLLKTPATYWRGKLEQLYSSL